MSDAALRRAVILPVPEGVTRPDWSVMIPTYDCARYLAGTLRSVLAQAPGAERMQIEVVDDHSTADDPARVVREVGGGRVGFFRQSENVGHTRNFETCLQRARGRLIHLLHGDDQVCPGFYATMESAFAREPSIGAAFCRTVRIDEEDRPLSTMKVEQAERGILANALERLALEQRIMTPSMVVRRAVYEQLGGFDRRLLCAEDWEMWVRIAAHFPIWYEPGVLAKYRVHAGGNTGRHLRTGVDAHYTRMAIDLFSAYLPPAIAGRVRRRARQTYALSALRSARALARAGDAGAARALLREALKNSRSAKVLARSVGLMLWVAVHPARSGVRAGVV